MGEKVTFLYLMSKKIKALREQREIEYSLTLRENCLVLRECGAAGGC
jgi:hypothetical protein